MQKTNIQKLTRNMMLVNLMKETGFTRDRADKALEELEVLGLVNFNSKGDMKIRVDVEVV